MLTQEQKSRIHAMRDYEEILSTPNHPALVMQRLETKMTEFDQACGGGLTTGIHTLCALPGIGKTTFTVDIAANLAMQNIPVLFFSFEMSEIDIFAKAISYTSAEFVDNSAFEFSDIRKTRKWSARDIKKYAQVIDFVKKTIIDQLIVIDCMDDAPTAEDIVNYVEDFIELNGQAPVVIIDYLQLISATNEDTSAKNNLENVMFVLQKLAKKHNLVILAISATTKQATEELSVFAAAEASRIAYSSITVMGLEPPKASKSKPTAAFPTVTLKFYKNRYGQRDSTVTYAFDGAHNRFIPLSKTTAKKDAYQ